jgi:hypothetical protein
MVMRSPVPGSATRPRVSIGIPLCLLVGFPVRPPRGGREDRIDVAELAHRGVDDIALQDDKRRLGDWQTGHNYADGCTYKATMTGMFGAVSGS